MNLTTDTAQRILAELETAEAASAVNALCREHVGDALVRLVELAGSAAKPRGAAAAQRLESELQRLVVSCDALRNSEHT